MTLAGSDAFAACAEYPHFDHGRDQGRRYTVPRYVCNQNPQALLVNFKKTVEITGHRRHGSITNSNLQPVHPRELPR